MGKYCGPTIINWQGRNQFNKTAHKQINLGLWVACQPKNPQNPINENQLSKTTTCLWSDHQTWNMLPPTARSPLILGQPMFILGSVTQRHQTGVHACLHRLICTLVIPRERSFCRPCWIVFHFPGEILQPRLRWGFPTLISRGVLGSNSNSPGVVIHCYLENIGFGRQSWNIPEIYKPAKCGYLENDWVSNARLGVRLATPHKVGQEVQTKKVYHTLMVKF